MDHNGWEPKVVAFWCLWCTYAGGDLAGSSRIKYPPNTRVIKVPCSSRVDPLFVMKALQNGLDGVWVSGCHPGDCHYQTGNYYARRKFALTKKLSEFMGIKPERITFSWIAASEGQKIAETASKVVEGLTRIGKNELFSKNESQG